MGGAVNYPCVVVGAGEVADYSRVAGMIASGAFVVCADGGTRHLTKLGVRPSLLVGDFDSLTTPLPEQTKTLPLSPQKDYTDSFHAVEAAVKQGYTRLLLTGMLGGRLDHTLANLQLMANFTGQGVDILLTDGVSDCYTLTGGGILTVPCREGFYFSVLALSDCYGVRIMGGKYILEGYDLSATDPRAISNEFVGRDVVIKQKSGVLCVVSSPK